MKIFYELMKEFNSIIQHLKSHNQVLYEDITKHKVDNPDGTFISIYLQMYEYEILRRAIRYAQSTGQWFHLSTNHIKLYYATMVL